MPKSSQKYFQKIKTRETWSFRYQALIYNYFNYSDIDSTINKIDNGK